MVGANLFLLQCNRTQVINQLRLLCTPPENYPLAASLKYNMNINSVPSEENYWAIVSEVKKADNSEMCLWKSGTFLTE